MSQEAVKTFTRDESVEEMMEVISAQEAPQKRKAVEPVAAKKKVSREEHKKNRFNALAPKRVENLVNACRSLRNLSGSAYSYTPEQAEKILKAVTSEIRALSRDFKPKQKEEKKAYKFSFED